jgi:transcriptional regulator with XRE-family HTH domain
VVGWEWNMRNFFLIREDKLTKAALIGKRIRLLRLERNLHQGDIAEASGISRSHLSKIESGKVENPGLLTLERIAKALKVTISLLLHFDERSLKRRIHEVEKRKKEQRRKREVLEQREKEIRRLKREVRKLERKK